MKNKTSKCSSNSNNNINNSKNNSNRNRIVIVNIQKFQLIKKKLSILN